LAIEALAEVVGNWLFGPASALFFERPPTWGNPLIPPIPLYNPNMSGETIFAADAGVARPIQMSSVKVCL
jgi:hypothetical protein